MLPACLPACLQLEAVNARVGRSNGLDVLVGTALASVHRPALVLLPWCVACR